jgi:hypothetical protein
LVVVSVEKPPPVSKERGAKIIDFEVVPRHALRLI